MLEEIKKIFKEEEPVKKLKDIDLEKVDSKELEKICEKETDHEIQQRLNPFRIFIREIKFQAGETIEERMSRRQRLQEKASIMQKAITEKHTQRQKTTRTNDTEFSKRCGEEQYKNIRYSFEPQVQAMQTEGTTRYPINHIQWSIPDSPIISVPCLSGQIRKLDLRLLSPSTWRELLEQPLSPIYIVAESSGMTLKDKNLPIWSDQGDLEVVLKQSFHFATVLALMMV